MDFVDTTGSWGGSPEIAQKNIEDMGERKLVALFQPLFPVVYSQGFSCTIIGMSEKQQRLVLSIIEFLNQSIDDGTVKADDRESLEVASASF